MTEPSIGEILRRLEEVSRSLEALAQKMEASYVRRDTHDSSIRLLEQRLTSSESAMHARMEGMQRDIGEQEQRTQEAEKRWKQALFTGGTSLAVALIIALVNQGGPLG